MHSPPWLIADGADYTGGLYTATFSGSSTTSVPVPTLPDDDLEGLEYFTGVIQVPPETTTNYRVTAGSPDTAMVNIIDATSEFTIHVQCGQVTDVHSIVNVTLRASAVLISSADLRALSVAT